MVRRQADRRLYRHRTCDRLFDLHAKIRSEVTTIPLSRATVKALQMRTAITSPKKNQGRVACQWRRNAEQTERIIPHTVLWVRVHRTARSVSWPVVPALAEEVLKVDERLRSRSSLLLLDDDSVGYTMRYAIMAYFHSALTFFTRELAGLRPADDEV